jgi:hypothetical protein
VNQAEMQAHGKKLLLALYTQNQWIIRTVERVTFVDQNTVRRRVIRHFSLPSDGTARAVVSGTRCLLPVFALPKGSFISCDLRNADDHRIALRPIEERWDLTFHALFSLLREAEPKASQDAELAQLAKSMIRATHTNAEAALGRFRAHHTALQTTAPKIATVLAEDAFWQLAEYLAWHYLVFADVELNEAEDHMISYVVDQRFADRPIDLKEARMQEGTSKSRRKSRRLRLRKQLGLAPHSYYHPWTMTGAGSSHLEIRAPDGVYFGSREVKLPNRKLLRHNGTSNRYARFLAPRTVSQGEGYAKLRIHPGSGVMRTAGPIVGALFTLVLIIVAIWGVAPTSAATLLLILPGFTSFVAARANEHPYVSRVVRGVRYLTLFPIPVATLAVAVLVAGWPRWLLAFLVLLSLLCTAILFIGARRLKVRAELTDLVLDDLTRIA